MPAQIGANRAFVPPYPLGFDIFCRVIDNYGDIGVCWRLAKQLSDHPQASPVRLWVDDLDRFADIEPQVDPGVPLQAIHNVQVMRWDDEAPAVTPYKVVIEAFACTPPTNFVQQLQANNCVWINLEYLSAEDWIEDCHGLPSLQPNGANKHFFFPGFTSRSGGLLREPDLAERRAAWHNSPKPRLKLLDGLGMPDALRDRLAAGWRQVFLFCYPDAPADALAQALENSATPTVLITPRGVLPDAQSLRSSSVCVFEMPFVNQEEFDQLLWSSDLNIVRGEDSLVRAIWAGKPFLWHIYPQDQQAHLTKLEAWLGKAGFPASIQTLMHAWNAHDSAQVHHALTQALQPEAWSMWRYDTTQLSKQLASQPSLVDRLLAFSAQKLDKG